MTPSTSLEAASNAIASLNARLMALETAFREATSTELGPESPLGALMARVSALEARLDGYVASLSAQIVALDNAFDALSAATTVKTDAVVEDITEVRDLIVGLRNTLATYTTRDKLALTRDMVVRIMAEEAARTPQNQENGGA
jgi:hypothetical protein